MLMIDQLIKEKGLKKKFIYEQMGVTRQAVSKWKKTGTGPAGEHYTNLMRLYSKHFGSGSQPSTSVEDTPSINYGIQSPYPGQISLPYISVPARAGFIEMSGPEGDFGKHEHRFVELDYAGEDLAGCILIEVDGDSMEPQLPSGAKVIGRPVDKGNWPYMPSGVYAISYANSFVIKRIKNNTISEGILTIHSDNTDTGGSLDIPIGQIHYIWKIIRGASFPIR